MPTAEAPARERLLTIGSVCRRLKPYGLTCADARSVRQPAYRL
jgi:hypothetical protein